MTLRRCGLLLSLAAACLVLAVCRYETIWTGVEFDDSGKTIRLASAEPLCGCLQITNISSVDVYIRSMINDEERPLGSMNLAAGATARVHFDWAGPHGGDAFVLDTWTWKEVDGVGQSTQIDAQEVLRIDETGWPWQPCLGHLPGKPAPAVCEIGPLKLDTGRGQL
jgi:hypothetical protein